MSSLIILLVIVAAGFICRRYLLQRQENKLRENFPRKSVIEVALPRGISDSNKRMQKFYRKAVTACQGDMKARKAGMRQVDIVYLAEVKPGHTMAEIRFLIYADEDKMPAVKRSLKQVFDGMASVMELAPEGDPMEAIAAQMRPPEKAGHSAGHDDSASHDSDS